MSKKTIRNNPLEVYLRSVQPTQEQQEEKKEPSVKKQRVTIHLSVDLINRVKDAVYWEPGLTLTLFTQKSLENELKKLEKKRGEKYPERKEHNLKGGRPLT